MILNIIISSMAHWNFFSSQDSKDSSLLESNKKRKGRLNSKESKRKKEDLQEVDGEIEAVLQKKGEVWALWVAVAVFALREATGFQALLLGGPSVCRDNDWKMFHYLMDLVYLKII